MQPSAKYTKRAALEKRERCALEMEVKEYQGCLKKSGSDQKRYQAKTGAKNA